jgi:PKD repeat protein
LSATVPKFGIFPFTLVATDKSSCYADTTFRINLKKPPGVNMVLDTVTCQGYSFDARYTGDAEVNRSKFTWTLSGDTISNGIGQDRIHVQYGTVQTQKGLLLFVDERGCQNQSAVLQVNMVPGLNFSVSDTLLCEPSAFTFSATSTKNVVDYLWDWGDGMVEHLTKSPAIHKYSKIGHYTVQLTATTDKSCVNTIAKDNLLHFAPAPVISFSMKENQCLDLASYSLLDQGTGKDQDRYNWDLSGILPGDLIQNPGYTRGPLIFNLKSSPIANIGLQVITKEGCVSQKKNILLQRKPVFSIQASDSAGCAPFVANMKAITGDSIDQVDYSWNFGDTKLASGSKVTHSYVFSDKIYDITLAAKSKTTGCLDTLFKTKFIRVYPRPTAAFKVDQSSLSLENPVASFINESLGATKFTWTFDDGSISHLKDPTHKYVAVGIQRALLESINDFGCSDTVSAGIIIPLEKIFVPNAFSPRAINEVDRQFFPFCNGVIEQGYHLRILSRWNEVIFEAKDRLKGWNGRLSDGSLAPVGNYIWILYYADFLGKFHYQSGTVTLVF